MKQLAMNLLVSLCAVLLVLLALELLVRYRFSHVPNYDFEMWRYAAEVKEPIYDPKLPFHHKPHRVGRYYGAEIRTNSQGLRDVERITPKPPGSRRIVLLGDSFALGWGVTFSETIAQRLEQKFANRTSRYEVINMGTGNYNSTMEVELFKRKGLALEPDTVVLLYYINDVEAVPEINPISYAILKQMYLPAYITARIRQLKVMNSGEDGLLTYYSRLYATDSDNARKARNALQELVRLTADKKIKLLMVNIPDLRRLKAYPFNFATALPQGVAAENSVPFLDLLPFFNTYDGNSLWVSKEDPHMNGLASGIAAQAIFNKLVSEKLE
jgi:lysophospholipase L1-like esterase